MSGDLTALIVAARAGERGARRELFDTLYNELRTLARGMRYVGRNGETLQATALTNEIILRLMQRFPPPPVNRPESRATFFRSVALAMRKVIHENWRARQAAKRGGGKKPMPAEWLQLEDQSSNGSALDALALDEALEELKTYNARWYDVVLYRFFASRTKAETAELLGCAESTVASDWQLARAWLLRRLEG